MVESVNKTRGKTESKTKNNELTWVAQPQVAKKTQSNNDRPDSGLHHYRYVSWCPDVERASLRDQHYSYSQQCNTENRVEYHVDKITQSIAYLRF